MARIAGIISGGFNLISFMGLHMSEMYSTAPKFLQRFAENLKFDIVPIGIAKYLGSLPMFSPNVVRGKI